MQNRPLLFVIAALVVLGGLAVFARQARQPDFALLATLACFSLRSALADVTWVANRSTFALRARVALLATLASFPWASRQSWLARRGINTALTLWSL